MEKFLGVLFCGGRGTRLGEITRFISKSFVPIHDRPVFRYGLDLLEKAPAVDEIVILTNDDNDAKFKTLGYPTIIQDADVVFDMFSGWQYIKHITGTQKHGVLVPSDNVTDVDIQRLTDCFIEQNKELVFSLYTVPDRAKLAQMGCYDTKAGKFYYKHPDPPTSYGVIAPYVVKNTLTVDAGDNILDHPNAAQYIHEGYWFDIGDHKSIIETSLFIMQRENR